MVAVILLRWRQISLAAEERAPCATINQREQQPVSGFQTPVLETVNSPQGRHGRGASAAETGPSSSPPPGTGSGRRSCEKTAEVAVNVDVVSWLGSLGQRETV